jgi:hypothetical protein
LPAPILTDFRHYVNLGKNLNGKFYLAAIFVFSMAINGKIGLFLPDFGGI